MNRQNKRDFEHSIQEQIKKKFGRQTDENEVKICEFVAKEIQWIYTTTGQQYFYEISLSAKSIAENYEPKFKKPGSTKSTKLFSPDNSQRTQNSPKIDNPSASSIWPQAFQLSLLINCGTETTDGLIRVLGNTIEYDYITRSTIGIYETNTKTHIISEFITNPDSKMFVITKAVKDEAKKLLDDDGLLNREIIKPVLEKIIDSQINEFFNKSFFKERGFDEFIELIENTTICVHLKSLTASQTKTVYKTLGTKQVTQSNLNFLWSAFSSHFMDEIFVPKLKTIGNKKEEDILKRLLNSELNRNEPLYATHNQFYSGIHKNLENNYKQQDLFFMCYLPLYFYNIEQKKFIFDYKTNLTDDKKLYSILWGYTKEANQLDHIYKSIDSINTFSETKRKEIIDEWRTVIFDLHHIWSYLTDFEVESNSAIKFKNIHGSDGEIAKQIKKDIGSLSKPNIQKIYNFDHDGTCPITNLILNLYSYIRRTRNMSIVHAKTIIELIPKHYNTSYVTFLNNPNNTDNILEDSLISTWKEEYTGTSIPSALELLNTINGDSIGSDGIIHIHNQFFNEVLINEIEKDPIFKSHAAGEKVKAEFLKILENNKIDYETNPIMLTTHGVVVNYGNPNDSEYINIGHFKERKDGGLVYVYDDSESNIVQFKFLCERRDVNQQKEKNVEKDHNKWWEKQIRYTNYKCEELLRLAFNLDNTFGLKMMSNDTNKYYTHNIDSYTGVEKAWKEYKNAEYLKENLKKIVESIKDVNWVESSDYELIDYITNK